MSGIETLMDRWENDPGFRAELRRDPEGAVRAAGVSLSDEERTVLGAIDWSQSDEELSVRASKMA